MISLFVSAAKKDWQIKGRNGYDENEGSFRTQRLNLGRAVVEKSSALLCHYVKKEGRKEGRAVSCVHFCGGRGNVASFSLYCRCRSVSAVQLVVLCVRACVCVCARAAKTGGVSTESFLALSSSLFLLGWA